MRAGFEVDEEGAAAGASGGFFEGQDFGVFYAFVSMGTFADFFAGGIDDYCANHRVGRSEADAGTGQF